MTVTANNNKKVDPIDEANELENWCRPSDNLLVHRVYPLAIRLENDKDYRIYYGIPDSLPRLSKYGYGSGLNGTMRCAIEQFINCQKELELVGNSYFIINSEYKMNQAFQSLFRSLGLDDRGREMTGGIANDNTDKDETIFNLRKENGELVEKIEELTSELQYEKYIRDSIARIEKRTDEAVARIHASVKVTKETNSHKRVFPHL